MLVLAPVNAELGRSSLHASIDGWSCELDVLEDWDRGGDRRLLETSDRAPRRTSEKVLSACTATRFARRDRGRGVGADDVNDAPEVDVGDAPGPASCGDSALSDVILVETSDGDLSARAVGPPGPKADEGLPWPAASFEPETPLPLALTNETDEAEVEDNADPGRLA
jgi:hypothetical protein